MQTQAQRRYHRNRAQERNQRVLPTLLKLKGLGQATAPTLGITAVDALRLEDDGLIQRVSVERSGKPGRPAVIWKVAKKGHGRIRNAQKGEQVAA